jgi:hypothetical protein
MSAAAVPTVRVLGHVDELGYLWCVACKPEGVYGLENDGTRFVWSDSEPHRHERCDSCGHPLDENGRAYVGAACTLDGYPASVCGSHDRFARIRRFPDGMGVQYAWSTVARIMGRAETAGTVADFHAGASC